MTKPNFPDPAFAWVYCVGLLAILVVATYTDLRRRVIPKWVTLPLLGIGVVLNLVRGVWLDSWSGLGFALLFSLAGLAVGFALFLGFWLVGQGGGGDVKLFAAVGAWIGPLLTLYVFMATLAIISLLGFLRVAGLLLFGNARSLSRMTVRGQQRSGRQRFMAYSLPVLLGAAAVLFWILRAELGLSQPRQEPARMEHQPPHERAV